MSIKNKFLSLFNSSSNNSDFENLNNYYKKVLEDIENEDISGYDRNLKYYNDLKDCELFSSEYYITNQGLELSEEYALAHYLNEGYKQSRNPSPEFNNDKYLRLYPDVRLASLNPLAHYVLYGEKEGRRLPLSEYEELENEIVSVKNLIYQNRVTDNLVLLRDKVSKGKKVNVVFVLPAMMFVYKDLYNYFDNDDMFNVQIVLVPHRLGNSQKITDVAKDKHYQIFSYLKEKQYNVIDGYDFEKNEGIDLVSTCNPDIIFYVLPYMRIFPKTMKISNLPSNILYAYIPYGEFVEDNLDDLFFNFGWNEIAWKIFCSTEEYLINSTEKSIVGSSNVVLAGSARMDSLINFEESDEDYKWIYSKEENKKRIIWAPHHTLARPGMDDSLSYSTFDENFEFFYNYAKDHPDIEWVIRPHPLLKEVLSNINTNMRVQGIADENFADDYFFKWESLPNARFHEEIDYFDLFATADAMITDCISFKAEYLFANKPGLILNKTGVELDGYQGEITDAWYNCDGSDFEKIEEFIEDVVVGGNDYLKEKREEIFNKNFNVNLGSASKVIFDYIKNELT
ncbi:hypothetical protein mru_1065 [Methanobrevibacter ruminantium M1]|uniref:CDP-glycerol:poly(Glycerophosphate) glycerophosphotransferase n=1 Tax=Methanobrevibacter ruminantium (strain ATCC 35063 / DSM 1093 / JCM 13430 / OCM 146 / M1) TaxID=634498 RepID=D3E305_METRM|nr:CDP-glycerol glycerophosphotransferase family protein [Methanobrevibacter ruminantium]ADC46916.1 hypothetical protein mru_1065 [Methanobrevibacter ruminantium M1]